MGANLLGRALRHGVVAALALAIVPLAAPGCSVGEGNGTVTGTLDVPNCWSGTYALDPDFFAAVPFSETGALTIRIQNGADYQIYSDGLSILVDNVHEIRGDPPYSPSLLGDPLTVSLPPQVSAPGIATASPSLVHMTVYLQQSCPTQDVALYALDSVSVDAQGNCNPAATGPFILACNDVNGEGLAALADAGAMSATPDGGLADASAVTGTLLPASPPVKHSTITFTSLFDGNEYESNAAERLTQATFDVYLGDPRDACPGGGGPPPPCRGHLTGQFSFYFEVGRPGQPFPGNSSP